MKSSWKVGIDFLPSFRCWHRLESSDQQPLERRHGKSMATGNGSLNLAWQLESKLARKSLASRLETQVLETQLLFNPTVGR